MFYPSTHGAPFTVVSARSGERYWRLGRHDAQLNPGYYVPDYVPDGDGHTRRCNSTPTDGCR
ncbi:hypothetical protein AB0G55_23435 [Streptomyces toyocaensis]|nr:hypothetical protein [Streptomyces toyocaensis]